MTLVLRPVMSLSSADQSKSQSKLQRLRRELESKRIQNLKKIQDVFRKTAEDDLETLLAFVRSGKSSSPEPQEETVDTK